MGVFRDINNALPDVLCVQGNDSNCLQFNFQNILLNESSASKDLG